MDDGPADTDVGGSPQTPAPRARSESAHSSRRRCRNREQTARDATASRRTRCVAAGRAPERSSGHPLRAARRAHASAGQKVGSAARRRCRSFGRWFPRRRPPKRTCDLSPHPALHGHTERWSGSCERLLDAFELQLFLEARGFCSRAGRVGCRPRDRDPRSPLAVAGNARPCRFVEREPAVLVGVVVVEVASFDLLPGRSSPSLRQAPFSQSSLRCATGASPDHLVLEVDEAMRDEHRSTPSPRVGTMTRSQVGSRTTSRRGT